MDTKHLALTAVPLFKDMTPDEIALMLSCLGGYTKKFVKGDYIILDGDAVECVGVLIQGTIQMIKEDAWGEKSLLVTILKNQIFGETFVFGGVKSTVSFVSTTDAEVLFLPFRRIFQLCGNACAHHQKLVDNMVEQIARKNLQLTEKLEITSKKTMRARILTYLSQQSQIAHQKRFTVPHGRLEMADYLCVDRSALTRELSRMRDEGLIDFDKNEFRVY